MKYSIGRAVLEVCDAAEREHGRSFRDAEVVRDLGRRGPCLHRSRAAVELEAELLLVRLEEGAVAHVELQDRGAERMRHVRGRHDERLAAQEPQPLEEHDLLRLRQLEHRGDVRRDRLHLEPQHLRLQPLTAGAEVFVEARQRLRDELRDLRLGDERAFSLESGDEALFARGRSAPGGRRSGSRRSARRATPPSGSARPRASTPPATARSSSWRSW